MSKNEWEIQEVGLEKIIEAISEDSFWTYVRRELIDFLFDFCMKENLNPISFFHTVKRKSLINDRLFKFSQSRDISSDEYLIDCGLVFGDYCKYCIPILDELDTTELTHIAKISILLDEFSYSGYKLLFHIYSRNGNLKAFHAISLRCQNMLVKLANSVIDQLTLSQKLFYDYVLTDQFRNDYTALMAVESGIKEKVTDDLQVENCIKDLFHEISQSELANNEYEFTEIAGYTCAIIEDQQINSRADEAYQKIVTSIFMESIGEKWTLVDCDKHLLVLESRLKKYRSIIDSLYPNKTDERSELRDFELGLNIVLIKSFSSYYEATKKNLDYAFHIELNNPNYKRYLPIASTIQAYINKYFE